MYNLGDILGSAGMINLGRETFRHVSTAVAREWQVTNGIGGFASSTLGGINTRRYHGLLIAALDPPGGRTLFVSNLDVQLEYHGQTYHLGSHEYADGTVHPRGFQYIDSFKLDGLIPVWQYAIADALIEKTIWMVQGENTTYVLFRVLRASADLRLHLRPLCVRRDFHHHHRGQIPYVVELLDSALAVRPEFSETPCYLSVSKGNWASEKVWYWNFRHRVEALRGLDSDEDLFCPGVCSVTLKPGEEIAFCASLKRQQPGGFKTALRKEKAAIKKRLERLPKSAPAWIRQLCLAGSQFLVERRKEGEPSQGLSIIAGYPWFTDWSRDTMLSLPGLTLACGQEDSARQILETYAGYVNEGMLPNRFLEHSQKMEYNSVDAALLFIYAWWEYYRRTEDNELLERHYSVLREIILRYYRGTRHNIHVDPADELLYAGEPGVQLTWMDAKVGSWVVTPRIGKAVEVNALWYNALEILSRLSEVKKETNDHAFFAAKASATKRNFQRFWNKDLGCLFDVLDTPDGKADAAVRSNQILAVALPFGALKRGQEKQIVEQCANKLFTPVGLRSLSPEHHEYHSRYGGSVLERDGAYHQGTVWTWPLGFFVRAYFKVTGDKKQALSFLEGIRAHLDQGMVGTVAEIFDAEPPHEPRGCFAQAWSVAEVLHAWQVCHTPSSSRR